MGMMVGGILAFGYFADQSIKEHEIEQVNLCTEQCHNLELVFFDNEDGCWCLDYENKETKRIK